MNRARLELILASVVLSVTALGQTNASYIDLHDFGGSVINANGLSGSDGMAPNAGVTFDGYGNMYGTACSGGSKTQTNTGGMVWEITTSGEYRDLHDFGGTIINANGTSGPDGQDPMAKVTFDGEGNMYGTAAEGGANVSTISGVGAGMVWEITASGAYLDLHDFGGTIVNADGTSGPDGVIPAAGVTFDSASNMYGTTEWGGANASYNMGGMVWEITASGEYRDLHDFNGMTTNADGTSGPDGITPIAGVTFDSADNLYGTTVSGGANSDGTVWEITASGTYRDLLDFGRTANGASPEGGVTIDGVGNLYGTTTGGGANGEGTVWEITASGTYRDLHDFGGTITNSNGMIGPDGTTPYQMVVTFDSSGNMYGTAIYGGANWLEAWQLGGGMVWEITATGEYRDLHDFGGTITNADGTSGPDGNFPPAGVVFDSNGRMYSTATQGGPYGQPASRGLGMVWSLFVLSVNGVTASPTSVVGGNPSTGTVTLSDPAGPGGAVVALSSSSTSATLPPSVTVAAGSTTATFTITTSSVASNVSATIMASLNGGTASTTLSVEVPLLSGLTISPNAVVGGNSPTGIVSLARAAPSGGATVSLIASAGVGVPPSVTVAAGSSSASFSITTIGQSTTVTATITASLSGVSKSRTLSITAASLTVLSIAPNPVTGGNSTIGTLNLNGASPAGGISVNLTSNFNDAKVPASVTIASGEFSAQFPISTKAMSKPARATITATCNVGSQTASLTIQPAWLLSVSLSPSAVVGGSKTRVTGAVTLTGPAVSPGDAVKLSSSNNELARVPAEVRVLKGSTSASFSVSHRQVASTQTVTITASYGAIKQSATLTLNPFQVVSLALAPPTVTGGKDAMGTVTLNAEPGSGSGAVTVKLSSSSSSLKLPAEVGVAEGSEDAHFVARTIAVATSTIATVMAIHGSSSQSTTLSVLPPNLVSVTVSTALVKGSSRAEVTGTVTISSAAPVGGLNIALTSSNSSAASVPATVKVATGQTRAIFKVTHFSVTADTPVTITAMLAGTSKATTLTVTP